MTKKFLVHSKLAAAHDVLGHLLSNQLTTISGTANPKFFSTSSFFFLFFFCKSSILKIILMEKQWPATKSTLNQIISKVANVKLKKKKTCYTEASFFYGRQNLTQIATETSMQILNNQVVKKISVKCTFRTSYPSKARIQGSRRATLCARQSLKELT